MTPSVLKDTTAFRPWREEFERWAGLKIKGTQEILKLIGGKKQWSTELQEEVDKRLKKLGYLDDKEEMKEAFHNGSDFIDKDPRPRERII